jgi:enoyl-CoA hydratase/carnithine racemase
MLQHNSQNMIDSQISDGLCVLRLDSPPINAISLAMLDELRTAVRRANAEPDVHAIVITGGPTHFSAGADLADFQAIRTADAAVHMASTFQAAFGELENSPKPVVAAVAGNVLGGALELAIACHFRIGAEGSRFSMPEIRLGINPGAGGTQRLPRLVGLPAALEMLLTG